ncbi:MAG: hypothetical protein V1794_15715 [Candidatus Glassbacteria bacterium]
MTAKAKSGAKLLFLATLLTAGKLPAADLDGPRLARLAQAAERAAEAFSRTRKFLDGWSRHLDGKTGLLPQSLDQGEKVWTPENSAADNFPFMLIAAWFTDYERFEPLFRKALAGEKAVALQQWNLPSAYDLTRRQMEVRSLDRLIFGASEYAKDGLVPMLEILGPGPWSERMAELVEGIFVAAAIETKWGKLPSNDAEVNGELLQILCRLFWISGRQDYLEWARRIGDAYCFEVLPGNHQVPAHIWDFAGHTGDGRLMLRDHGCEIISGLSLLFAIEHYLHSEREVAYLPVVERMLRRAQEIAVDSLGFFYNEVDAASGEVTGNGLSDCWGYDYYAWVTMSLVTEEQFFLEPVKKALSNLSRLKGYRWEPHQGERGESQDGIADAVEGALLLASHLPDSSAFDFVEHEAARMFTFQREDGVIEGWWGDGNFARTALMYAFYKTRGTYLRPWRKDLRLAAEPAGDSLFVYLSSARSWRGKLCFDRRRYREYLSMPVDFPRINAFPQWYAVLPDRTYWVEGLQAQGFTAKGRQLAEGIEVSLKPGRPVIVKVNRVFPN